MQPDIKKIILGIIPGILFLILSDRAQDIEPLKEWAKECLKRNIVLMLLLIPITCILSILACDNPYDGTPIIFTIILYFLGFLGIGFIIFLWYLLRPNANHHLPPSGSHGTSETPQDGD